MEGFDTIRALARVRHGEACAKIVGAATAAALLDAATEITGIERQAVADNDPLLRGSEAVLVPSTPAIFYKNSVSAEQAAFYQAHEFAHHWIDGAAGTCSGGDIDDAALEERMPLGVQRVEGYGPRERRECQANVFAREFLLPCQVARRLFINDKLSASAIATRLGLPLGLVYQQLAQGLLIPESIVHPRVAGATPPLDAFQKTAAEACGCPHLVEAGPGTGKTRTLIARLNWLLDKNVEPSSILALTFSNKAAEEIRERVAVAAPEAAPAIWAGTFHAFGLEILRKYGDRLGLSSEVRIVDPADALVLLDDRLDRLPLDHYLTLYEPTIALRDILLAISRAKDELVGPVEYRRLGEVMLAAAGGSEDARLAAEKVIEIANVFEVYEAILTEQGAIDFADLILKPIALLREHDDVVQSVRSQYTQILVDEYQDVNRASGVFLKLLNGNRSDLWVVGDARQSIYRFRGASPANIRAFETDFPGAKRLPLGVNYRSQSPIVRLVEAYAPHMQASVGGLPAQWKAERGDQGGQILMEIGTDIAAEAAGLAAEIVRRKDHGVPFRDQAILCRSHTNLARFAARLEAHGVPVLYLGDLFERPEIRDMLALLSFFCEPTRGGLVRVAQFVEYAVPLNDVRIVLQYAKALELRPFEVLPQIDKLSGLSEQGTIGLKRLAKHTDGIQPATSPATVLFEYLFDRSRYLDVVMADPSVKGQQMRLALFQLLQFAVEYRPALGGVPQHQFLRWIRRIEVFGDERQLRQIPAAANGIDAVRLLTVHASKGLEFPAVYIPALGDRMFPVQKQYNPCPPPAGMLSEDPAASHAEEEQCLFFVAMSRARDHLCLSRPDFHGQRRAPSPFLTQLSTSLPSFPGAAARWRDTGPADPATIPHPALAPTGDLHSVEDLDQYMRCPLAYFYQRLLGLSGGREDNAYVQFHRAVYAVLRWMTALPAAEPVRLEEAMQQLAKSWAEIGPSSDAYGPVFWKVAVSFVERAVTRRATAGRLIDAEWEIPRSGGRIRVRPDHVEQIGNGFTVRRWRTGRPPKKVDGDIYALYHQGASTSLGSASVEVHFLTSDTTVPVAMTPRVINNRLEKYDQAIAGIKAGYFDPIQNDRFCPRCPQYFICPAVPGNTQSS